MDFSQLAWQGNQRCIVSGVAASPHSEHSRESRRASWVERVLFRELVLVGEGLFLDKDDLLLGTALGNLVGELVLDEELFLGSIIGGSGT